MRALQSLALLTLLFGLCACSKEVTWSDIQRVDAKSGTILGPRLFYCGSDLTRHHFRIIGQNSLDDHADVWVGKQKTSVLVKERPHSTLESDWVQLDRRLMSVGYTGGLRQIVH